jgi:hypothetical protein
MAGRKLEKMVERPPGRALRLRHFSSDVTREESKPWKTRLRARYMFDGIVDQETGYLCPDARLEIRLLTKSQHL